MSKDSLIRIFLIFTALLLSQAIYAVQTPVAAISASPTSATVGQTVTFDGSSSYDPDGTIESYQWKFPPTAYYVSGTDDEVVRCKFNSSGMHTVKLMVQDNDGLWSTYDEYNISISAAGSSIWYVSTNGDDDNNGQSWVNAFKTIQIAIDSASDGETLKVASSDGVVPAVYYEQLDTKGKNLMIISTDPNGQLADWELTENTMVDAQMQGTAVVCRGSESTNSQIQGMTFTGGYPAGDELALHLKLDGGPNDDSDKGRHGIIVTGDPNWIANGCVNGALEFDGDDYLEIDGYKGIAGRQSRTCAAWIRIARNSADEIVIVYWGTATPTGKKWDVKVRSSSIDPSNSKLELAVQGGTIRGETKLDDGHWHHVAVVMDDEDLPDLSDVHLYVDGRQEENTTLYYCTSPPDIETLPESNIIIGANFYNGSVYSYSTGFLDDVRIYSRALGDDEIQVLAGVPVPVVYLPFDTNADDISGNDYHGEEYGNPSYFNNAIELDGANDYVELPSSIINPASDPFSVFARVYLENKAGSVAQVILQQKDNDTEIGRTWLYRDASDDTFRCYLEGVTTSSYAVFSEPNQWHHVGFTYDGQTVTLYADGQACGSSSKTALSCSGGLLIGKHKSNPVTHANWDGMIDEFQIFKRVLSAEEVAELTGTAFDLQGHWTLDGDPNDCSANGYESTVYGDPDWTSGYDGQALELDGDDYIEVDDCEGVGGTQARTTCAWVKLSSEMSGAGVILSYGGNTARSQWLFMVNDDNKVQLGVSGGNIISDPVLQDNQWYHLAAVLDDWDSDGLTVSDIKLYIDGVQTTGTYTNPGEALNTGNYDPVRIGVHPSLNSYFNGLIDDVHMYSCVLTDAQIKELADADPQLLAHWKMDGSCNDASDNGHDGTEPNDVVYCTGLIGDAIALDGSQDITVDNHPQLKPDLPITLSVWINHDTVETGGVIVQTDTWDTQSYGAYLRLAPDGSDRIELGYLDGEGAGADDRRSKTGTTGLQLNCWYHVAGVIRGAEDMSIYINGIDDCGTYSGTGGDIAYSDGDLTIGSQNGAGAFFEGLIDDVRLYDYDLSVGEVMSLYQGRFAEGGGIKGHGALASLLKSLIIDNESEIDGGGVFNLDGTIVNNVIVNNTSQASGGGVADSNGLIENNTIYGNTATVSGGGIADCNGIINNNIIWGNTAAANAQIADSNSPSYSNIQNWSGGGTGNITTDPNFVDATGGDFHLIAASMAIDSGDSASSYSYEPEPNGDRINIGAYGNTPEATAGTDTDGDNLTDRQEIALGYDPNDYDMDDDLIPDGWEYDHMGIGFDPEDPNDAAQDFDLDDLPNLWEYENNLDPNSATGSNGNTGDPDSDGVENFDEYSYNLNPWEDNRGLYETQNEYDDAGQVILTRSIEISSDGADIYVTESQTVYDVLGRQIIARQVAVPGRGPGRGADDTRDRISLTEYYIDGSVAKTAQKLQFSGLASDPNNLIIDDVNDIVTENEYDSVGRLEKTTNPEGYETSYTYTTGGKVKTVTDPNGNVTTNYYDGVGRLERVVNPLGHSRTMDYDSMGRVLRQIAWEDTGGTPTDPNDDTPLMQQWYAYDGMGHVIRQAVLADANSPATYVADPNVDKVTDFVYDDAYGDYPGMLVEQTIYYAGGNPATAATTTYDYDLLARRHETTDPANNFTLLVYDIAGRVVQRNQLDDNQRVGEFELFRTEYAYDALGRLASVIADPNDWTETQTTTYAYGLSQRVKETKPNGVVNTTEYNTFGEKIKTVADTAGIKQTTEWGYDRVGRMETITGYCDETDTNDDQTTTYTYDKLGNVTLITYPDGNDITYVYNDFGRVKKRTDQRNLATVYVYNAAGNLITKRNDPNVSDPNATYSYWFETFTYDGLGRQLTAEKTIDGNDIAESVFAYNAIGMLTSEKQTLFGGTQREVTYGYDQFGYRTSIGYPDGSTTITRTNKWNGQIDTLSRSQTELVDYKYMGGRTVYREYNTTTPVAAVTSFDGLGRVTDITAGSLVDFHYDYVADENNIWKKRFDHRTSDPYNAYSYDDIDRVTGVTYHNSETEGFTMDDLGNRTNVTLRDTSTDTYSVDTTTNRYNSIDSANLDYDNAGNLTTDKDGYQFTYDYENRITKIVDDQDTLIAEFDYDTQGRRIRVYDAVADANTLYYYSDNWQVLSEYDDSGSQQAYYIFGNYIDEVLVMNDTSNDYYYLHDHLYSPVVLLNNAGAVQERYEYDAYGKMTRLNPNFTAFSGTETGNPYYFTGREVDRFDNDSLILQHNRNRYLSQYMGRWFSHDPLGLVDSVNLYEYVISNPILYADAIGLTFYNPLDYEFSTDWPALPRDYERKWEKVISMYGEDKWKRYNPYYRTQALMTYMKVFGAGAILGPLKSWQPASIYLANYGANTGNEVFFMVRDLINEVEEAKDYFEQDIDRALAFVEENIGLLGSTFYSTTWPEDEPDYKGVYGWEYAIQQYWVAAKGKARCQNSYYEMDYTYKMEDIYWWDDHEGGIKKFGVKLTHRELQQLHRYGFAKMFKTHGLEYTVTVKWRKGQRVKTGEATYRPKYGGF